MASPSKEFQQFTSERHAQRYRDIYACNIIEEKAWVLKHGELLELIVVLKKQKPIHLNAHIQSVARDLVLEFFANAYRAPYNEATGDTQLARVEELDGRKMLRSSFCLGPSWLKEKTVAVMSEDQRLHRPTYASEARTSEPPRQATSDGVPRASLLVKDEDSQEHIDRMPQFCFMQDMYAYMGAPGLYLTHQSVTWASAQRFMDRFSEEMSTTHYGR
ncbi:hypothetical protein KIW84_070909 [Lathyrus oleraceus]|uniref:Uncharacterized protein n=1 Tax=Pisum sativum TaxID=3888 RepID=A0A9D4VHN7_PEA|nr:hypothetical protein KIW84_070909 [Pisum sativum]